MARFATADKDTHDHILRSAITIFAQKGFDSATGDAIAEHAGVSKGAIYWHFKNKNELFIAALQFASTDILSQLEAIATDSKYTISERLEMLVSSAWVKDPQVEEIVDFVRISTQPNFLKTFPFLEDNAIEIDTKLLGICSKLINEGVSAGEFDAGKARIAAILLAIMTDKPIFRRTMDMLRQTQTEDDATIVSVLLDGIRKR